MTLSTQPAQLALDLTAKADFDLTVLPLADNLYGAAMRLTKNPTEAEDLVQDTMVRAFKFWESFTPGTNAKAWMFTILRNTFINGYHKRSRIQTGTNEATHASESFGTVGASDEQADQETAAQSTDTIAKVRWAIQMLPENYRLAVTLRDLEGLTYLEIVDIMDCPMGTVMSRIYRGRKMLKAALEDHAAELGLTEGTTLSAVG